MKMAIYPNGLFLHVSQAKKGCLDETKMAIYPNDLFFHVSKHEKGGSMK